MSGFETASADRGNWMTSLGWMAVVGRRGPGVPDGLPGVARQRDPR